MILFKLRYYVIVNSLTLFALFRDTVPPKLRSTVCASCILKYTTFKKIVTTEYFFPKARRGFPSLREARLFIILLGRVWCFSSLS